MQKTVTKYFEKADEAIKKFIVTSKKGSPATDANVIESAYKGAVSSFGAGVVMSGIIPTIQFYMASSERRDTDSQKIVNSIAHILGYESAKALKDAIMKTADKRVENQEMKRKVCDAAIALKIMMRSYEFVKTEKKENNELH